MLGYVILALLAVVVAAPAIAHAVRPSRRSLRRAVVTIVLAGSVGVLALISGLIKSAAGVAGVEPSQKASMLAQNISESVNCSAFVLVSAVVVWALPFVIGEVRRKRSGRSGRTGM